MALDPVSTMVAKMRAKRATGLGQGPQLPTVSDQQVLRPSPRVAPRPAPQPVQQVAPAVAPEALALEQFTQPAPVPAPTIPALPLQTPLEAFAGGLPPQVPANLFQAPVEAPETFIPADASVGPVEGLAIPEAVLRAADAIQARDPKIRYGRAIDEAARILGLA